MESPGHRCPFLREVQVKSCQASSIRKVIPRSPDAVPEERCSSREYVTCPIAKDFHEEHPQASRCPFLHESLVQYCAASAVPKYIPYSESMLTRCGTENHQYCEQYLTYARPRGARHQEHDTKDPGVNVSGISYRTDRSYTPNHMWMQVNDDGYCHIGVDGFFASVIGRVEDVSFATDHWDGRPTAIFRACGIDMPLVFPFTFDKASPNTSLRKHPEWVTDRPFTFGWLFEGRTTPHMTAPRNDGHDTPLLPPARALDMLRKDIDRLIHHFTRRVAPAISYEKPLMADGGCLCFEEIHRLAREEMLYLYNEFFSPSRAPERSR